MKNIFGFLLIFSSYLFAGYEKVQVGFIDQRFDIQNYQVEELVKQIEQELESQVGINLFDYTSDGKNIDFIYMEPSQKKQNIQSILKTLKKDFQRIERLEGRLVEKQKRLLSKNKEVVEQKKELDTQILALNNQIDQFNNTKLDSKTEYAQRKKQIERTQRKLQSKIDKWNQRNRTYEVNLNAYNQLVIDYRFKVKQYNRLQRKVETLVRTSPEVQGVAKGYKQVVYKTFEKDGNTFIDKQETQYMEKIEIYGFESLAHLKAILAHELLHLVGIGHVESKGALMNPILQENQVQQLQLSVEDIKAIKKSF